MTDQKYIRVEDVIKDPITQTIGVWTGGVVSVKTLESLHTYTAAEIMAECWVPVTERLPPRDVRVLGCTREGWVFIGRNWTVGDEIDNEPNGVTHWMPLPQPPKEGTT